MGLIQAQLVRGSVRQAEGRRSLSPRFSKRFSKDAPGSHLSRTTFFSFSFNSQPLLGALCKFPLHMYVFVHDPFSFVRADFPSSILSPLGMHC
jgi:hypothetical protein